MKFQFKAFQREDYARAALHDGVVLAHDTGGGKTIGWDKVNNAFKRAPTEGFERAMQGIAVATYRVASIAALGMANAAVLNDDNERGSIILTSSAASQDGQVAVAVKRAREMALLPYTATAR